MLSSVCCNTWFGFGFLVKILVDSILSQVVPGNTLKDDTLTLVWLYFICPEGSADGMQWNTFKLLSMVD